MYKILKVKPLSDYKIWVQFSDGVEGTLELSGLAGKGVFSVWNDYGKFEKVSIGSSGELVWDDTVDLCSDALYMKLTGKKVGELFPKIRKEAVNA